MWQFLFCLLIWAAQAQICREQPEGKIIPDPSDCSAFYTCSATQAYRTKCSSPLLFNAQVQACDWPQNVQCGERCSNCPVGSSCLKGRCIPSATATTEGVNYWLGAYFVNWAQWRKPPYGPYTPADLKAVAADLDVIYYAFAYFDADTFKLKTVEEKDVQFYGQMNALKAINPNLRIVLSVGGWNFFSGTFSKMVSSAQNRAVFISSLRDFLAQYRFDGVDLDWEFPCSPPRTNYVQYSCWDIKPFQDPGGVCPADTVNFVWLVSEMRAALPGKIISIASPASDVFYNFVDLGRLAQYIDLFNLMAYDFTVPATEDSNFTAPHAPLYNPGQPSLGHAAGWSVNTAVQHYLASGVPSRKIMLGVPLYGHTWYVPNMMGNSWAAYGLPATIQGKCCGPYQRTYGGEAGPGSQQCGTLMLSEIQQKLGSLTGPRVYYDPTSGTDIAYSSDGLWISFDNQASLSRKVEYVKANNLAGMFVFDSSMDLIENGVMTYPTIKALDAALK